MIGPQVSQVRANQGEDPPWTKVERKKKKNPQVEVARDAKPRRRNRAGAKRDKADALVIKTEKSKNSDVLKAMRSEAKLDDLGADVRGIRREMIIELKRDKERGRGGRCSHSATEGPGRDAGSLGSASCSGRE